MAGCDLYVISGIDGKFDEFNQIEPQFDYPVFKLSYNSTLSFGENINFFRKIIGKSPNMVIILGWSIGAVAAAFLSDDEKVKSIVLINAFFDREEVLRKRNIPCDEQVSFLMITEKNKKVWVICGEKDDKIPCTESEKIRDFYRLDKTSFFKFPDAMHNIGSFPNKSIANITNEIKGELS